MSKPNVYVTNCWLTTRPYYDYPCLQGTMVSGHPYIQPTEEFWSSPIVSIDEANNIVETENSIYNVESWRDNVQQGVVLMGEPVVVGQADASEPEDVATDGTGDVPSPAAANTADSDAGSSETYTAAE